MILLLFTFLTSSERKYISRLVRLFVIHINLKRFLFGVGGGGGTQIFSHIRRLGSFFGFKILNFNIFLVFK